MLGKKQALRDGLPQAQGRGNHESQVCVRVDAAGHEACLLCAD